MGISENDELSSEIHRNVADFGIKNLDAHGVAPIGMHDVVSISYENSEHPTTAQRTPIRQN